jgi:hypothetical protein
MTAIMTKPLPGKINHHIRPPLPHMSDLHMDCEFSVIGLKSLVFELTASLGLPAAIIHTVVHSSEHLLHAYTLPFPSPSPSASVSISAHSVDAGPVSGASLSSGRKLFLPASLRSFAPTCLGLLCLPFLPAVSKEDNQPYISRGDKLAS